MRKRKIAIIIGAIIVCAFIIYLWIFWDEATVRNIASFCASLATAAGVIWTSINVRNALRSYKNDHAIRKKEIIDRLYERFLEDDLYELYERIKVDEPFELSTKNKKALNKALTLFDEIDYFRAANLFDDEIWEYIACEIVNLSTHRNVKEFLKQAEEQYPTPKNRQQKDMLPFTGFKALAKDLPDKYWFKKKPDLEEDAVASKCESEKDAG